MKNLFKLVIGLLFLITYTVKVNAQLPSVQLGTAHPARIDMNGCNGMNTIRPLNGYVTLGTPGSLAIPSLVQLRPSTIRYPGG